MKLKKVVMEEEDILVTIEEMEPEQLYWKYSLYAYILGQEIPTMVMVNFLKDQWRGLTVPKVVKYEKGFILRFEMQEDMAAVARKGIQFFYSKPLILQPWKGEGEKYDTITSIPVWVQLPKLPVGLWGATTLSKIASKIGEPVYTDAMTAQKLRLDYARILVKVEMGSEPIQEIPIRIPGREERLMQPVRYEWFPNKCNSCGKWGHRVEDCRNTQVMRWVPKKDEQKEEKTGKSEQKEERQIIADRQKKEDEVGKYKRGETTPQSKGKEKLVE